MQRKNQKKSADEKAFQSWVKQQPCCVTGREPVDVHHMYGGAFMHNKVHIGEWACIPLSKDEHQGMDGIHTIGKKRWCDRWGAQAWFWAGIIEQYSLDTECRCPQEVYDAIMDWGR